MPADRRAGTGRTRVRIVGDHPHRGTTGTVRDDLPMLEGMWRIDIDDRWTDACYAGQEDLRLLSPEEDPHAG